MKRRYLPPLSTIAAGDDVVAEYAWSDLHPGLLPPECSTIIRVLNAAFALQHFKSTHSKYPSDLIKDLDPKAADALSSRAALLLDVQELYKTQAQFANTLLEDFTTLSPGMRGLHIHLAKTHIRISWACKYVQLSAQRTERIMLANKRYGRSLRREFECVEEILLARQKSRNAYEAHKITTDGQLHQQYLIRQRHQEAQQVFALLRTLPEHEAWTDYRGNVRELSGSANLDRRV